MSGADRHCIQNYLMLQLIWNFLAYTGFFHLKNASEQKYLLLTNGTAIFSFLFNLGVTGFIFFSGQKAVPYFNMAFFFLIPSVLYLNSKGHFKPAKIVLFVLAHIYILYLCFYFGYQSRDHFYFLIHTFICFFMFNRSEKKLLIIVILTNMLSFSLFEFYFRDFAPLGGSGNLSSESMNRFIDFSFAFSFLICLFLVYSIFQKSEILLESEHEKSEKLLQNILPLSIIRRLRENPDLIAERFEDCTVLFSDIVGFTQLSRKMPADDLVNLLNDIFSRFDDLAEKYGLEKIKTIGDAYMAAGGLPERNLNHAVKVAEFALEMRQIVEEIGREKKIPIQIRIGIHSGDAVAGVIGKKKFVYDLWGDSVNTASRMESFSLPGQIQVSESTYSRIQEFFILESRGFLEVKGLGQVKSYFLVSKN